MGTAIPRSQDLPGFHKTGNHPPERSVAKSKDGAPGQMMPFDCAKSAPLRERQHASTRLPRYFVKALLPAAGGAEPPGEREGQAAARPGATTEPNPEEWGVRGCFRAVQATGERGYLSCGAGDSLHLTCFRECTILFYAIAGLLCVLI